MSNRDNELLSIYLLIEIVESAIFLSDQFFIIKYFERFISSLRSSNRNLSLCLNNLYN
jgi:hypothetical protein